MREISLQDRERQRFRFKVVSELLVLFLRHEVAEPELPLARKDI